ncbi:MAG: hypothetical protein K9J83_06515 [Desulfarculaceae bacterium]|nr:hypothetical protein [Desulfarculaceae bacterium]
MIGNRFFRTAIFFFCLLSLLLNSGCVTEFRKIKNWERFPWNEKSEASARKEKPPESSVEKEENKPEFLVHLIRWKGETLSIIAKWYIGRIDDWKPLADLNPELDPHNLQKGEKVRIPVEKLKTSIPMPKDFIGSFAGKPEASEKPKPMADENKAAETEKENKPKKEPPGETGNNSPAGETKGDESPDKPVGDEATDETADQEPDLFGPKELNRE